MKGKPNGLEWAIFEADRPQVTALAGELGVSPLLAQLLAARGHTMADDAKRYLSPALEQLSEPFALTDMDRAVERLQQARRDDESVHVFGDYDVDGMAATAVMVRALRRFGIKRLSYSLPHRILDGYGLNPASVDRFHREGVQLVVTVDNGIAAQAAAVRAREFGIDLIVTDHHAIEGTLPPASAVVNPKRDNSQAPFAHLCGTGVAFKLATALNGAPQDLDLVALATIADVMPLRDENRILTTLGLRDLARGSHLGLASLLRVAGVAPYDLRAEDIAFQVAPRLNASGRLGDGNTALELLLAEDAAVAEALAHDLNRINKRRKTIEQDTLRQARDAISTAKAESEHCLVLEHSEWHPGIIGVVASRLQEELQRPVALIAVDETGMARGSGRSTDNVDMAKALAMCGDLLVAYGGHSGAGGFTIATDKIGAFKTAFENAVVKSAAATAPDAMLSIDALVSLSEITADLIRELECLEPCGEANPQPVLACCGARLNPDTVRVLNGNHLRCSIRQNGVELNAIGFGMGDRLPETASSGKVDVAFSPRFNRWRDQTTIQLQLTDIRLVS